MIKDKGETKEIKSKKIPKKKKADPKKIHDRYSPPGSPHVIIDEVQQI